jgi:hypothetical protein
MGFVVAQPGEVVRWVQAGGWTGLDRTSATAVAMAASRGNPAAPGGLFGVGTTGSGADQAKAAYALYKARGWSAFPAYGGGAFVLWWPTAAAAVGAVGSPATPIVDRAVQLPGEAAREVVSGGPLDEAATAIRWLTGPDAWQRIVKVGIGVILISVGAVMFAGGGVTWLGRKVTGAGEKFDRKATTALDAIQNFQEGRRTGQTMGN